MKKVLIFSTMLSVFFACTNTKNEKEQIEMVNFGPEKVDIKKAISTAELLSLMEKETEDQEVTFKGEITEVCSKAGCWINIKKPDNGTFMVRFKDHFTIPTKTALGTEAYLSGIAYWDTVSVDLLRHFAEDAGKTKEEIEKITEPKFELAFEADGISFKKAKK
jgi:hypothetical protein